MRRFSRILAFILCACLLTGVVYAESSATSVESISNVSMDGSCQVSLSVTLHLDSAASNLTFPLPRDARNVTVNGSSARTYASPTDANAILVDLSFMNGIAGDSYLTFQYTLPDVLETVQKEVDKKTVNQLVMEIPLLCGFDYPIQAMNFTINMPAETTGKPTFSSGYMQTSIESIVSCNVFGKSIAGSLTQPLRDRETLTLNMDVSEQIFPGKLEVAREGNPEVIYMGICASVALLYWLLTMRALPLIRQHRTTPPEGITAGELGSHLTTAGADLTMMVFSWARLGYLRICPDKYGRVILQKRMGMGNERTAFENHCFSLLFARKNVVDATGTAYAKLCRRVYQTVPGVKEMYRRKSGNINLFRAVSCGVSLFSGVCFAMNIAKNSTLQVILSIVLGLLGVFSAWAIQGGAYKFHVRGKIALYISSAFTVLWILVGIIAGQVMIAVWAVLAQNVAGLAAAYGGKRSDVGRHQAGQILGLRYYLRRVPREELNDLMENNPDYFFEMIPYAIALGVDTKFARTFGNMNVGHCPYMVTKENRRRTAEEWALLMRKTADKMDKRQRAMELEKWIPITIRK